jgi:hypothetical protein
MNRTIRSTRRAALRGCSSSFALLVALAPAARAQSTEERLKALEAQNALLQQQVEALSQDVEAIDLGGLVPPLSQAKRGVGQGAAKVYDIEQGLSIGGYGEFLFQQRSGRTDQADALRAILYFGYKFDERWVFNSEIEWEHGSTGASTPRQQNGSVSLEFGYLDYLHSDALNVRAGLLLSPMGLVNQLHEPTTFLPASRPQTELRIIPSTWREMGLGVYGDLGDFSYQSYLMTALDGEGFSDSGLRGGRQKGARSASDDFSWISRLDYVGVNGLNLGGSFSFGEHGQDNLAPSPIAGDPPVEIGSLQTWMWELHLDYRAGPWTLRALYAHADLDGVDQFNSALQKGPGDRLSESMNGYYGEVGFDVLTLLAPGQRAQLIPFARYERIDTQAGVPVGADPSQADEIVTFGLNYKPVPQVVVKLDFERWDDDFDRLNLLFGYVF